jgi:phosphoserine phosphatase RsbU/P
MSVRERHARLLADPRASEPRARLAQAVSRAEFLLRVSRTVSAIQNPNRALTALVALLLEDVADVAQVVVRTGPWQLVGAGAQDGEPRSSTGRWVDTSPTGLDEAIRSGLAEEVVLPKAGAARTLTLSSILADEDLVGEVDALAVEQLAVLPLNARGRTFGLLVLGRSRGFRFSGSQAFLDDLAERIAVGLDASLVVAESRYVAGVLRRSLAPAEMPQVPDLDLATFYRVAHESEDVGGDFIDVHGPHDDLTVTCGDVAGKGVEAAVHAKRIRNAIRTGGMIDRSPAWILGLVNRVLVAEAEEFSEGLATATCARLRPTDGGVTVDLANAGHPVTIVLRADGRVEEVNSPGVALGLLESSEYGDVSVELGPRDTMLLYTDGVTEARGVDALFGEDRLREVVARVGGLPARTVVEAVAIAVSEHLGDRAHDDIAVIAVQYRPGHP